MDPLYGQRTTFPKKTDLNYRWVVLDAQDAVLGRLASEIARRLMGKHRPQFQPGQLVGDSVVVVNAANIRISSEGKRETKTYYRHSGYKGSLRATSLGERLDKEPEEVIYDAVRGMLPRNKFRNQLMKRLRVFAGAEHNLQGQRPEVITLKANA